MIQRHKIVCLKISNLMLNLKIPSNFHLSSKFKLNRGKWFFFFWILNHLFGIPFLSYAWLTIIKWVPFICFVDVIRSGALVRLCGQSKLRIALMSAHSGLQCSLQIWLEWLLINMAESLTLNVIKFILVERCVLYGI